MGDVDKATRPGNVDMVRVVVVGPVLVLVLVLVLVSSLRAVAGTTSGRDIFASEIDDAIVK
jgi:hypothetical protein